LQLTSKLEGRDIRKELGSLQAELSELVALGHVKLSEEVGAKGVNRRADLIAEYVADIFRTLDRPTICVKLTNHTLALWSPAAVYTNLVSQT
jgi:hypothetical protein